MYHIVYLTTNLVNNKIYVGVHSTYNLDDGYLGSGFQIKLAIKKYGKENFKRTILHFCLEAEHAYELEKQVVDDNFISRLDTYNVTLGGVGSFYHIHKNEKYTPDFYRNKFFEWWNSLSPIELNKHKSIRSKCGELNPMYGVKRTKDVINKTKHVGDNNPNSYSYLRNIKGLTDEEIKIERKKHITYKKYKIIYPNGEIYIGDISLKQLCRDYNLNYNSVFPKVKKNKFIDVNGWTILQIS